MYITTQPEALRRAEAAIDGLRGHTPAWNYLRPLEILRDELRRLKPDESVEMDVTQLRAVSSALEERLPKAPTAFARMLDSFTGQPEIDITILDRVVNALSVLKVSSVTEQDPEDLMFLLIGTYWGDDARQDLYSPDYFTASYWRGGR